LGEYEAIEKKLKHLLNLQTTPKRIYPEPEPQKRKNKNKTSAVSSPERCR